MSSIMKEDWIECELKQLSLLELGGDWGKDPNLVESEYEEAYCIRGSEFRNWETEKGKTASLRKLKKDSIEKRNLILNDILVEISGGGPEQPVGRTVVIEQSVLNHFKGKNLVCTNFLRLIRTSEFTSAIFINHYLKYFYSTGKIIPYQSGSNNLRNLKFNDYLTIEIPLAPLPIQRAIVSKIEALFSDLDNGIANFKKAQEQLKVYRQAVLKKAFEGELTKEWRKKNKIVNDWRNTTTGEVMPDINSGSTPKAEFLSTSGEVQFLKVYNLNFDGTLNSKKDPAYTTYKIHSSANKRAICIAGDVLINIVGPPLGKVSMIPLNSKLEFNINQAIVRFRPNENIDSRFLSFFLQNPETILWLESTSNTTAGQHNVKVTTCREIPINLPTLIEQTQIVQEIESRLSVCDKMEQSINESIEKAEALRQSILKKAFEGELLSEAEIAQCKAAADYEPAGELLKKIQAEKLAKEQEKKKKPSVEKKSKHSQA